MQHAADLCHHELAVLVQSLVFLLYWDEDAQAFVPDKEQPSCADVVAELDQRLRAAGLAP